MIERGASGAVSAAMRGDNAAFKDIIGSLGGAAKSDQPQTRAESVCSHLQKQGLDLNQAIYRLGFLTDRLLGTQVVADYKGDDRQVMPAGTISVIEQVTFGNDERVDRLHEVISLLEAL